MDGLSKTHNCYTVRVFQLHCFQCWCTILYNFLSIGFIIWHVYLKCELSYLPFYCHIRQDLFACLNFKYQLSEFIYNGVLVRVATGTTVSALQSRTQTPNLAFCVWREVVMWLNCMLPRAHRTSFTIWRENGNYHGSSCNFSVGLLRLSRSTSVALL